MKKRHYSCINPFKFQKDIKKKLPLILDENNVEWEIENTFF